KADPTKGQNGKAQRTSDNAEDDAFKPCIPPFYIHEQSTLAGSTFCSQPKPPASEHTFFQAAEEPGRIGIHSHQLGPPELVRSLTNDFEATYPHTTVAVLRLT